MKCLPITYFTIVDTKWNQTTATVETKHEKSEQKINKISFFFKYEIPKNTKCTRYQPCALVY